jgi:beta-glucosidase
MKNNDQNLLRNFRVNVTNTGSMPGDDVVLGFISSQNGTINGITPPIKQLFGFKRVHLNVNETTQVFFPLNIDALLMVAHDGSKWLHPGHYTIIIGKQIMHTIQLKGNSVCWIQSFK